LAAVIDDATDRKSMSKHFVHPLNFNERMRQKLGVIDGDLAFGRFFLAISPFIDLLGEMEEGLKRGRLNTEMRLNEKVLKQIRTIWFGEIYMVVVRDPFHEENVLRRDISYSKDILLKPNEKLIRLPSLRNLNPTDEIKEEKMLLGIREAVDNKDVFERDDVQQVVLVGGMVYNYKDHRKPQFRDETELRQAIGQTMNVGRNYFHCTINFLHFWFRKNMDILMHDIDQILLDDIANSSNHIGQDEYHMKTFSNKLD
jgi:hypothetical protein